MPWRVLLGNFDPFPQPDISQIGPSDACMFMMGQLLILAIKS